MKVKRTAAEKIIGDPEIDAVIASIHKQFGRSNLISLGPSKEKITPIPTGAIALDIALGIGGIPSGRIVEIFGSESTGKTSLALLIAKQYDTYKHLWGHDDRYILIDDVEHTIAIDLIESFELDPSRIIFARPDTGEEALQTLMDITKTGRVGLAILDSIDAIQTEAQLAKKMGENEMGGASKMLNRFMREYSKKCSETQTTAIFINQLKYNPNPYASDKTTPGGTGVRFYSSVRLETKGNKPHPKVPNSFEMKIKVVKNKVAPPRQDDIVFAFEYAKGPNPALDVITAAKELGIAYFAGARFMVKWEEDSPVVLSTGGLSGAIAHLTVNEEDLEKLRTRCLSEANISNPMTGTIEVEVEVEDDSEELDEETSK